MNVPKVNDTVFIQSEGYTGEAVITYIADELLYQDHLWPIQVEIEQENLDQFDEFNHGQTMYRTNLKEILAVDMADSAKLEQDLDDVQGSFDF